MQTLIVSKIKNTKQRKPDKTTQVLAAGSHALTAFTTIAADLLHGEVHKKQLETCTQLAQLCTKQLLGSLGAAQTAAHACVKNVMDNTVAKMESTNIQAIMALCAADHIEQEQVASLLKDEKTDLQGYVAAFKLFTKLRKLPDEWNQKITQIARENLMGQVDPSVPDLAALQETVDAKRPGLYSIMGTLTIVQAMARPLSPGENRSLLAKRADALLKREEDSPMVISASLAAVLADALAASE